MAIQNFDFPGVTLKQVFAPAATGTESTLGVACIGPVYKLHNADYADEAALVQQTAQKSYSPTTGLLNVEIPKRTAGTVFVDDETCRLQIRDGIWAWTYPGATAGTLSVSGSVATLTVGTGQSALVFKAGHGSQVSALFGTRGVKTGDFVYLTKSSSTHECAVLGITSSVPGGAYNTLIIDAPSGATAASDYVVKFAVKANAEIGKGDGFSLNADYTMITQIDGGLSLGLADIYGVDESESGSGSAEILTGYLQRAIFYLDYRERLTSYVGQVGVIGSEDDITDLVGRRCPENPIAQALYYAFTESNRTITYFTEPSTDTAEGYSEALDLLSRPRYSGIHGIVPCTEDAKIITACSAAVIAESEDEKSKVRRALWYGISTDDTPVIASGSATLAVAAGSTKATVTFAGTPFVDNQTQAGDVCVINGTEYTVYSDNNINQVVLLDGPTTGAGSVTAEIVRKAPTNAQLIKGIIAKRIAASYRCRCVWADDAWADGAVLSNFCVAAAAAGKRAYEECWRPLSNLGYSSFQVKDTHGFTRSQLKELGAEGIWIVDNNDSDTPVNLKAVTSAVANDVNLDNESVISNADEVALALCRVGENMVGNSNISDSLLMVLSDTISGILDRRTSNATSDTVGNQLISWSLLKLYQDTVAQDEVYADIEITPPKPFNKFHMTMRVL